MGALAQTHFGHLPVWLGGNAYFNGATVCKHEKDPFVNDGDEVRVALTRGEDGHWALDTNVYDLLGDYRVGTVNSDTLGCAFEPEQRFENPDGTEIIFDSDYLGDHRSVMTLPGPFADPAARHVVQ